MLNPTNFWLQTLIERFHGIFHSLCYVEIVCCQVLCFICVLDRIFVVVFLCIAINVIYNTTSCNICLSQLRSVKVYFMIYVRCSTILKSMQWIQQDDTCVILTIKRCAHFNRYFIMLIQMIRASNEWNEERKKSTRQMAVV